VSGGQAVHGALPEKDLYFPATQAEQDPVGPVLPAGHKFEQSLKAPLPAGDVVPAGQ